MKRALALTTAVLALAAGVATAAAAPNGNSDPQATCHATGSESNPYVIINPSADGAANGHASDAKMGPSSERAAQPHASAQCDIPDGGDGGFEF